MFREVAADAPQQNNPYRALDLERDEAEWNAMDAAGEFDAFKVDTDRLDTLIDIAAGLITCEAAIAARRLSADDKMFEEEVEEQTGEGDPALRAGL